MLLDLLCLIIRQTGRAARFVLSIAVASCVLSTANALPSFARKYGVGCGTCHSVAPRLNTFGLAFQANHFHWPGANKPPIATGINRVPISGILTGSREQSFTDNETTTDIRELELFSADGFRASRLDGGFFANFLGWSNSSDEPAGSLENAYVTVPLLPLTSRPRQVAITAGQFEPLHYQWSGTTSLLEALPGAFADEVDGFSFADAMPGVRVEVTRRPDAASANGAYGAIGVPFAGHINFNHDSEVGASAGMFAHGYVRRGYGTAGLFGFTHAGRYSVGALATESLHGGIYLLAAASLAHDDDGAVQRLSVEAEYVASPRFAITGRVELLAGAVNDFAPVAGVTWYPVEPRYFRLTAEMSQRKGDRTLSVFVRGQF
jgi:hypothetical protein